MLRLNIPQSGGPRSSTDSTERHWFCMDCMDGTQSAVQESLSKSGPSQSASWSLSRFDGHHLPGCCAANAHFSDQDMGAHIAAVLGLGVPIESPKLIMRHVMHAQVRHGRPYLVGHRTPSRLPARRRGRSSWKSSGRRQRGAVPKPRGPQPRGAVVVAHRRGAVTLGGAAAAAVALAASSAGQR